MQNKYEAQVKDVFDAKIVIADLESEVKAYQERNLLVENSLTEVTL
jgi:hypothetical protein